MKAPRRGIPHRGIQEGGTMRKRIGTAAAIALAVALGGVVRTATASVMPCAPPATAARGRAPHPLRDVAWPIRREPESVPACERVSTPGLPNARPRRCSVP